VAALTHLDTHVAVWLYANRQDLLSDAVRERLEVDRLAISPMAVLELTYLREIGRITADGPTVLAALGADIGLEPDPAPLAEIVERAHACSWTRDPFDRVIAAHAIAVGATLLTRDASLQEHVPGALW
jgi:PIN domain nuclease of toxin-antitoxin system